VDILWAGLDKSEFETQSQRGTDYERCWRQQSSTESPESSLYLINIAIVLGLEESHRAKMDALLRQQIETAVWNSRSDLQLKTSVKFLQDVEDKRRKELQIVSTCFLAKLGNHREATQVRDKLNTAMGDGDSHEKYSDDEFVERIIDAHQKYSVYEFMQKIEDILVDSHESQAREPEPEPDVPNGVLDKPNKLKEFPTGDWGVIRREFFSALRKKFSRRSRAIQTMLNDLDKIIQDRQTKLADGLIEKRNAELENWKNELSDRTR